MIIFNYLNIDFVKYALVSITFLSIISPIVGTFLLLRRLSFFGAGLSHLSFAGIALGILFKKDPVIISALFTSVLGTLSYYIYIRTFIPPDIFISILFSFGLAFGMFVLGLTKTLGSNIFSYLFGSILLINEKDIFLLFIFFILILIYFLTFRKEIIITLLSREISKVFFKNIDKIELGFIFLCGLFVVFTIKLVGIILSTGFIVIPTLFGLLFGKNFYMSIILGIIFSFLCSTLGLFFSLYLNVPPGGTILLTMILILQTFYFLNYLLNRFFKKIFR